MDEYDRIIKSTDPEKAAAVLAGMCRMKDSLIGQLQEMLRRLGGAEVHSEVDTKYGKE